MADPEELAKADAAEAQAAEKEGRTEEGKNSHAAAVTAYARAAAKWQKAADEFFAAKNVCAAADAYLHAALSIDGQAANAPPGDVMSLNITSAALWETAAALFLECAGEAMTKKRYFDARGKYTQAESCWLHRYGKEKALEKYYEHRFKTDPGSEWSKSDIWELATKAKRRAEQANEGAEGARREADKARQGAIGAEPH